MGELAELPDLGELDMQLPDAPDLEGTQELASMDSLLDRNWDTYVSELGARGIAEQLGTAPSTNMIPLPAPHLNGVSWPSAQMPLDSSAASSLPAFEGSGLQLPQGFAAMPQAPQDWEMPAGSHELGDDSAEHQDQSPTDKKGVRKPKRNAKQQQQNKAAQQRYRERRKQRFNDMEHVIDDLNAQLKAMADISAQNTMLQNHTKMLQSMIQAKDAEVEDLRNRLLDIPAPSTAAPEPTPEEHRAAMDKSAAEDMEGLKEFLAINGLNDADPLGKGVDTEVLKACSTKVAQACSTAHRAMRSEGLRVLELMSANCSSLKAQGCKVKWGNILKALRLTSQQQTQIMTMRRNHMAQIKEVFQQRQQLNMQAMGMMVPFMAAEDPAAEADGRIRCLGRKGYTCIAGKNVSLNRVLDKIKANLRLEQKRVMELNFVLVHRVLSPIQAAIFMVQKYPEHVAGLTLANHLAYELGQVGADSSDDDEHTAMRSGARPADAAAQSAQSAEQGRVHLKEADARICPLLANGNQQAATWGEHLEGVAHLQGNGFSASNGSRRTFANGVPHGIEDGLAAPCSSHSSGEQEPMLQASTTAAAAVA